jgi:CubicO group peptidase (beta-lactamase class C family)
VSILSSTGLGLLCTTLLVPSSSGRPAPSQGDLGARIDDYLERLVPWGFSGAVLVSRQGRVVLANGYGLGDREAGARNSAQTVFALAGVSEQFTAAAILLLEERGRLSLDDPLARHFPNAPADKQAITLRQLLANTSGLPPLGTSVAASAGGPADEAALARWLATPLVFAPGSRAQHSEINFSLLAKVIEQLAQAPYEEFVRANLFLPAQMTSTGFVGEERWRDAQLARGRLEDVEQSSPSTWLGGAAYGWGAVLSTAGDLYRWDRALENATVLGAAARDKLLAAEGPACGWSTTRDADGKRRQQSRGAFQGFTAEYLRLPDDGVALIVLSNAHLPSALTRVEELVFARECPWPPRVVPLDERLAQGLVGAYELPAAGLVRISFDRSQLTISAENQGGVDALTQPSAEARAWQEQFGPRTLKLLEHLRSRDFPAAASLLQSDPRTVDNELGTWWRHFEDLHGASRNLQLTCALYPDRAVFARLEFERSTELCRLTWLDNRLASITAGQDRFATGLLWPRASDYVTYDPTTGKLLALSLLSRADQSVRGLTLHTDSGDLTARKLD